MSLSVMSRSVRKSMFDVVSMASCMAEGNVSESNIESSKSSDEKASLEEEKREVVEVESSIGEASKSEAISNIGTARSSSSESALAPTVSGSIGENAAGVLRRDDPILEDHGDVGTVDGRLDSGSEGSGDVGTLQYICSLSCLGETLIAWLSVRTAGKSPTVAVRTHFLIDQTDHRWAMVLV